MFGWRKKNDGFDWHTYVRTTIKVRREARRERIDAARQAALEKAHAAGAFVAAGGKAAGAAAVKGAQAGVVHGAQGVVQGVSWLGRMLGALATRIGGPTGAGLQRLANSLASWPYAGMAGLVGLVALVSGAAKLQAVGLTAESALPLGLGLLLLSTAIPAALAKLQHHRPAWVGGRALTAVAVGTFALAGVGTYALLPKASADRVLGALSNVAILPGAAKAIEGRAIALNGDTLRLNGQVYVLAGIEAPDRQQACMQARNRRWRCGERALAALEAAVRPGPIACLPAGSTADAAGRLPATCSIGGRDIADGLVRQGHVFALPATFGGYGTAEAEARARKVGLWSGEAERPSVYRAKLWDAARKASPEGCPIKGTTQGGVKVFVQPWESGYRRVQVRAARGERWFCSAADAVAAGFRAMDRPG
jgi:endonuclease YncB( thermonuclease family)